MKKSPHVIWVSPTSRPFYRSKGEVLCRPGSVIPKLVEEGIKVDILIPRDPTLLPKTKLAPSRITRHKIHLGQDYTVELTKLTRGSVTPGIYMASIPSSDPALANALFSKAALALAILLKRPVDIFHLFNWEGSLLPLFLDMEKNGHRVFKNTHTFLNVTTLREQGSFAPSVLSSLGIPQSLFHPEGLEFYGRVSYLKAGLMFADGVGIVENLPVKNRLLHNGHGFEGILDAQAHKLRRWASERSVKSHLDAYYELMRMQPSRLFLPRVLEKVHVDDNHLKQFIESWGPIPPDNYNVNGISLLVQAPTKAYAFWEWTRHDYVDYGVALDDRTTGSKNFVSRNLHAMGDYWFEVHPGHEYVVELIGFRANGTAQPLLRSRPVRMPRNGPSKNIRATFIDVRSRKRFEKLGRGFGLDGLGERGTSFGVVSSLRESVSSL